ncbi:MAG: hypothetical protein ACOCUO_00415 [archaeon]
MDRFDEMFKRVSWMKPVDSAILSVLEPGYWMSPNNISKNSGYQNRYVGTRCQELHRRGLLEREANGDPFYRLTELGQQVSKRELSPEDVEKLTHIEEDEE